MAEPLPGTGAGRGRWSRVLRGPFANEALLQKREAAQGIGLFADPDAVIPPTALREGSPGHEALVGNQVRLERDATDENHERTNEESWED